MTLELGQFQLGSGDIFGAGSNYCYVDGNATEVFQGAFDIEVKTQDVDLAQNKGIVANPDFMALAQVHIPVLFRGAADVGTLLASGLGVLVNAWVPVSTDVILFVGVPGFVPGAGAQLTGRPVGIKNDLSKLYRGVIRALLRFDVTVPTDVAFD